jgi:predicted transcriptional regulator
MPAKADLRVSIDAGVKARLDTLAEASGCHPGVIVEQALRLILDPLPALVQAQALLAAYQQRAVIIEDHIRLIADYIVDAHRAAGASGEARD